MGKGTLGDTGAFLGFTVFAVAVFAICYMVLYVTCLSLVTVKRGTKKRAGKFVPQAELPLEKNQTRQKPPNN